VQNGGYARDHRWLATLCEHQGGVPFAWLVSLRRGRNWSPGTGRLLCALLMRTRSARAGGLGLTSPRHVRTFLRNISLRRSRPTGSGASFDLQL
jgi:hypothetical protein